MRVLLSTQPAYGHFHPMLPLATALGEAGHEVHFAAGRRFCDVVRSSGFEAHAAGLDWLESDKSGMPPELRPRSGCTIEEYFTQQFVSATATPFAREAIALSESWRPDVIVRERTEFGGAIAADHLGIPAAAVQVGSPSLFTPAQLRSIEPAYNLARGEVGLAPDEGLTALQAEVVFSAAPPELHDPEIPLPPNFIALRPTALDRSVGGRLPGWAEELGHNRPLIYATLGTVFNNPLYELPFFPAVSAGLAGEPVEVVMTVGPNVDPASLGPQPANVHVAAYLPQSLLFPHCAAIICHAGFGTLVAAIQHAVPIVAVPFGADQHINARSVDRLGIGVVVEPDDLTPHTAADAVRSVLEEPFARDNIAALRDAAMKLPPVEHAVATLCDLEGSGVGGSTSFPTSESVP